MLYIQSIIQYMNRLIDGLKTHFRVAEKRFLESADLYLSLPAEYISLCFHTSSALQYF
jgi:hypothetical protein